MTTNVTTKSQKPSIAKKPSSPFLSDPYNNRSGNGAKRGVPVKGSGIKTRSLNVPKFKGGSGGDR